VLLLRKLPGDEPLAQNRYCLISLNVGCERIRTLKLGTPEKEIGSRLRTEFRRIPLLV
jgi:hypothetical protein